MTASNKASGAKAPIRIYQVTVSKTIYVAATEQPTNADGYDMHDAAEDSAGSWEVDAYEVTNIREIPNDWRDGIPYGDHKGDTTIRQFMEAADDKR